MPAKTALGEKNAPLTKESANQRKIPLKRLFTKEGIHPFDEVNWRNVNVTIRSTGGHVEERDLEFPDFWSDSAASIAGSKYFRGRIGSPERESSVRQMITRVATTIRGWGLGSGYFDTAEEADIFAGELSHILLHQKRLLIPQCGLTWAFRKNRSARPVLS